MYKKSICRAQCKCLYKKSSGLEVKVNKCIDLVDPKWYRIS